MGWSIGRPHQSLNVEVRRLAGCSLTGPLDSSLSKLKFLSYISLGANNWSSLVPIFAEFSFLEVLYLRDSGIEGLFPQKIFELNNLENLVW